MDPWAKRTVTVNIEPSGIRILGVRAQTIEYWAEIPIDSALVKFGAVTAPEAIGELIATTFDMRGLPRQRVIAAVPGYGALSRTLVLPSSTGRSSREVEQTIRRLLPPLDSDTGLFWQPLPSKTGESRRVFVLATPNQPIRAMIESLRVAGIRPLAVELKPLALYRAVQRKDAIIANVESTSIDIVIVVDDLPVTIRSIDLGTEGPGADGVFGRLTDELSRAIRYYNDTNRQAPLADTVPIVLSTDGSEPSGQVGNIEVLTGHEVVWPSSPLAGPEDFPVGRFLVNVGLALKRIPS